MNESTVIALGFFDGVHIGHGALLRRVGEIARREGYLPAALTFDHHPKDFIPGAGHIPLLNTPADREELMHRLYGTKADLKNLDLNQLRACSYSMMRAKRIPHVMGVEEEAVKLAQRWGADPELARRAGILHDCTKYYELPEQLDICEEYGVRLDALEQKAVKLLHSKTGACIARGVFGQPDAVYDAIFWHTTGKADMTTLEKVLYIADYMEPNRDFDGVERLRHLAYTDLDKAMLLGAEMTIQEMQQRQVPIHKNTLQARDWLRQHGVTTED